MAFMGLYTSKEVEDIRKIERNLGYLNGVTNGTIKHKEFLEKRYKKDVKETKEELNRLFKAKTKENEILRLDFNEISRHAKILSANLKEKEKQIEILKFHLKCECDTEIKRLEIIAKRTKKPRIKKKCESRIIDYKMRKLAYEKDTK